MTKCCQPSTKSYFELFFFFFLPNFLRLLDHVPASFFVETAYVVTFTATDTMELDNDVTFKQIFIMSFHMDVCDINIVHESDA